MSVYDQHKPDDDQEIKPSPSREGEVFEQEKLIEDMEQSIDQNTSLISRSS